MVLFLEAKRVLSWLASLIWLLVLLITATSILPCNGGSITSSYVRKLEESEDMPYDSDVFRSPPGYNAPQQVHITQGDSEGRGVIVSWVTVDEAGSNKVVYWNEKSKKNKKEAEGYVTTYKYYNYTSGYIHHCTIKGLEFSSKYYYMVGTGNSSRTFWFKTPPPIGVDVPYTFGLIGDLGQTFDSNNTLTHYEQNPTKGQAVLYVGDLSYADEHPFSDNRKWDSWGRFVERSVAYQPWIWTAGNHDIDYAPDLGETVSFKPFTTRYPVPYNNAEGSSQLWYSIKRASAHIIVLSSYSACAKYTPQYMWLQKELEKVDRKVTPWLIVMMHSPLYNSYNYHYMEADTMRVVYESWFVQHKVDIVFAGHVHAYERSVCIFPVFLR
ncbi:hypothetical protein Leryth_006775 [Lithospermum erythrorhizon]|nr:hypothetical protein Leryth_006775 [Lithospermum erythrorhizon]